MREIKFRGKATSSIAELDECGILNVNGWVYGNLIIDNNIAFIVGGIVEWDSEYIAHEWWQRVDVETLGEYTGLKDKNGKEIYEGDIVKCIEVTDNNILEYVSEVKWDDDCYIVTVNEKMDMYLGSFRQCEGYQYPLTEIEVIGNMYEDKKLLESEG